MSEEFFDPEYCDDHDCRYEKCESKHCTECDVTLGRKDNEDICRDCLREGED